MIYLDNAATSFPKPKCMIQAMEQCMKFYCGNPGRSGHNMSTATGEKIYETRNVLAEFLGVSGEEIIFTSNTTMALNMGIKGVLQKGDHVIASAMEHNSVFRPIKTLEKSGIKCTIVKARRDGSIRPGAIKEAIGENTKLIVITAASNVTGTLMPLHTIGEMIQRENMKRKKKILFLIDGAQAIGHIPIDLKSIKADMIAFPGHKGLLGPQGTGGLFVAKGIELKTILEGGTGTASRERKQPLNFPEDYEVGTVNAPGIIGLGAAVEYVRGIGIENIRKKEGYLISLLDSELHNMKRVIVYGPDNGDNKTGVTLFNIQGRSCEEVAGILNDEYKIAVRAGFHCAGQAHRTIGTWNTGAVRVSLSVANTIKDIRKVVDGIWRISK